VLHALGLDEHHEKPWRNHYVSGPEGLDELVAAGLVEELPAPGFLAPGDRVFGATAAGWTAACQERKARYPKPRRDRARYLRWLECADAYGCSFGEFLQRRLYEEAV
jgi:hypothetical protein